MGASLKPLAVKPSLGIKPAIGKRVPLYYKECKLHNLAIIAP